MSTSESTAVLDEIDWHLLAALQADARQSFTALGRVVGLSRPAVAERVHRLEDLGVITGYRAVVDLCRLGQSIVAFTRIRTNSRRESALLTAVIMDMPEVQECYRGTGDDCYIVKIAVQSVAHLEAVLEQLRDYGSSTTSIVLSTLITQRPVMKPAAAPSV